KYDLRGRLLVTRPVSQASHGPECRENFRVPGKFPQDLAGLGLDRSDVVIRPPQIQYAVHHKWNRLALPERHTLFPHLEATGRNQLDYIRRVVLFAVRIMVDVRMMSVGLY